MVRPSRTMLSRLLLCLAVLAVPSLAEACPVCFSGRDESRMAYIWTTVLLTFTPLLMVGLTLFLIRRHIQQSEDSAEELTQISA